MNHTTRLSSRRQRSSASPRRNNRLRIEPLESRKLLSANQIDMAPWLEAAGLTTEDVQLAGLRAESLHAGGNAAGGGNGADGGAAAGLKWLDRNGDGVRDNNEPGLPGVTIFADLNFNGELEDDEPRTVTREDDPDTSADERGRYRLGGLPGGLVFIREVVPDGFRLTHPSDFLPPDGGFPVGGDGAYMILVEPGGIVEGLDFGNQEVSPGSVHGTKWLDANGNGHRDADEPGLAGITIYSDLNHNGALDPNEPRTVSMEDSPNTAVDETGNYWLEGLAPGRHEIREIVPAGFVQTFPFGLFPPIDPLPGGPLPPPPPPIPGSHHVLVEPGGVLEGIDFGNQEIRPASVSGVKWLDENGNGERESTEPGLAGVLIYSDLNFDGRPNADEPRTRTMEDNPDTVVNERGRYLLEGLMPGFHLIREVVPDGFVQTFPQDVVPLPSLPPFGGDGAHVVVLGSGQQFEGADFGNRPSRPQSVHGRKWLDANGNGERDGNEPGLAGVVIYSDRNLNAVLDPGEPRTRTMEDIPETDFDETGLYWLTDLEAGPHIIREVVPAGFEQTFPSLDPNAGGPFPGSGAHFVILEQGGGADGVDFGNRRLEPPRGSVHGVKWLDANANGVRDPDEPGLPGVIIYVDVNFNGILEDDEPRTRTMQDLPDTAVDETGHYWLEVPAGFVAIREIVPDGFVQTFPAHDVPPPIDPIDPIFPGPDGGAHFLFVAPGDVIEGIDFGNRRDTHEAAQVHGTKWLDRNGNGLRDNDEPGLPGVTIYSDLNHNRQFDPDEPHAVSMEDIPETDFDEAGMYWLEGLEPGDHTIREVVPDGFIQTFPPAPEIAPPLDPDVPPFDGAHFVLLTPGQIIEGLDFGNQRAVPGTVHGTKWLDANGNRERDPNEPGLPGVVVYSDLNFNGVLEDNEPHTVTMRDDPLTDFDESGLYWLELRPGVHIIREVVPDGFVQTFPVSDATEPFPLPGGHFVVVPAGGAVEGIDFGNQRVEPGSVHGVKWLDANGNRERDPNEPGLPGVIIYSDLNFNGVLEDNEPHTVTMRDDPDTDFDESGLYWLELRAGVHLIREVVPDGFVQTFPISDATEPFPLPGGHFVVVPAGGAVEGIDFGNQRVEPGSVHGIKWLDANGNRERDPDEPGLPGVTIYVDVNFNGRFDDDEPHTVTMRDDPDTVANEAGMYWLRLEAGRHMIREVVPDGFVQTFPISDATVPFPEPAGHFVILPAGGVIEGIDFGNQPVERNASVHGRKWLDIDGNGQPGDNEPGLPGVVIFSDLNFNGRLDDDEPRTRTMRDIPETDFDEAGLYWLEGLLPGRHLISEVVPDGFVQTFPISIAAIPLPFGHDVHLEPGSGVDGLDFGNRPIFSADFDADGDVDPEDFLIWQVGFGTRSGAPHSAGDADYDGDVDGQDFLIWQRQFEASQNAGPSTGQPAGTPSTLTSVRDAAFADVGASREGRGGARQIPPIVEGLHPSLSHDRDTFFASRSERLRTR